MTAQSSALSPQPSPFVGRQRELAALQAGLAAARAGHGGLALIVGEAGIGKTALARAFAAEARAQGATVLWGACLEGDWQPPYGPWVEALGTRARALEADGLARELGAGAVPLARLLPEVGAFLPGTPPAADLRPDEERFRLYEAVTRWLLLIARRPGRPRPRRPPLGRSRLPLALPPCRARRWGGRATRCRDLS